MKGVDLRKILNKEHESKWVAVSKDYKKVVGFSSDLMRLKKKVGNTRVVFIKVPTSGRTYAF
jgi:hypothetical protein